MKPWCVAHDLSPFRINIYSRHWTRLGAEFARAGSRYVRVMRTEDAIRKDRQLEEAIESGNVRF